MRLGLRAIESPVLDSVHFRALFGELMDQRHRKLLRVRIAEHVPLPNHAAHARELDAHRLEPAATALLEALLALGELPPQFGIAGLGEARVRPMSVREQHPWRLAGDVLRT